MKNKKQFAFVKKVMLLIFVALATSSTVYSQTPAKWAVNGNSAASTDFLGTTNNEDLVFKTNNAVAFKIKANGNIVVKSLDSFGNGLVTVDNSGKLIQVPFSGNASDVLLGDGTFGASPSGLWSTGTGSKIYYNSGKVGIGTSTPNFLLDVNGDVRIANNLYLQGALIISDKIQTPKQMKAGSIVVDSLLMDSTKAIYGTTRFVNDVKLQAKLSVTGDVQINGITAVSGILTAPVINTSSLTTTNFSVSSLLAANKISAFRIVGQPGDSLVRIGDSTIMFDYTRNRMWATSVTTGGISYRGLGLGTNSIARGSQSLVMGANCETGNAATYSAVIGHGSGFLTPLVNNIANTLVVGFNSTIPTLFVSSSPGTGTTGNVSIGGNTSPTYKFEINAGSTDAFLLKTTPTNQAIVVENSATGLANFKVFGNGKVYAREVNVQLGTFPDYVFSKQYNLLGLDEVSTYVNKNNHLPNMPSAEEVKQNGIGIGELQLKLVEKVEELTLYLIDQNEKLKQLEQDNIVLKKQVAEFKK